MPQVPSIRSEFIAGILAPMSRSHVRPAVMAAIIALPLFFVGGTPTIASGMLRIAAAGLVVGPTDAQYLVERRS